MKTIVLISTFLFFLTSCKEDTNPVIIDPPNPSAQKEIDWPSLKKSPWPMYRHDPQLTGRSSHSGPINGVSVGSIPAGDDMASVVIDNDSTIYIHCGTTNKTLSSWKYNGKERWSKNFFQYSDTYCTPILASLGFIYYVNPQIVATVYYDSVTYWNWMTGPFFYVPMFSPGIDKEGNLYIVEKSQTTLYVLKPDGSVFWQIAHADLNSGLSTISFSPDGNTLYVRGKTLCAVDITKRNIKWTFEGISLLSSPIIDNRGNIYFFSLTDSVSSSGKKLSSLLSLHPDGTVRWKHDGFTSKYSAGLYENEITIDWNGNIYAATDTLFSFTNDGKLRWKFGLEQSERNITGLTCDKTNTVFVLTDKNNVYAVSQNGGLRWKTHIPLQTFFGLTPSIADGKLFIPTWNADNKVILLE